MTQYVVAISTCPEDVSEKLARTLVEKRVCACVNIIPKVTSIYHWKKKIVEDVESILLMKTEASRQKTLWKAIKEVHPYDVPEFIILPIEWGSQDYLAWISQSVADQ